jgi:hypothetical protein
MPTPRKSLNETSLYETKKIRHEAELEELKVREKKEEIDRRIREFLGEEDALRIAKLHSLSSLLSDTILDEERTIPGSEPMRRLLIEDEIDRGIVIKKIMDIVKNMQL